MKKIILAFLSALLTACTQGEMRNTEIDRGTFSDGEYRNESLGFSLAFPDSWHIEQMGVEEFLQFDEVLDETMARHENATDVRRSGISVYFGLISSILPGAESWPPFLTAYLVDLDGLRGVSEAKGYLRHLKGRYPPQSDAIQIGDIRSGELGGREFYAISTNLSGVRSMEYATLVDEYALVFSLVYETDAQLTEARRVLNGIRFTHD